MCPNPLALSHGQMPPPPGTTSGGRTVSPKIHGRGLKPGPATQPRLEARAPQTQPGSDAAAGDRTCPRPPGGFGSEAAGGRTRRQDAGLKPTYLRRRGCGPTSRFMPLSSAPVDARPSMCLRCFERNEFHVSLSQTSPIGGAFAPGSQAQPPSPWTVARPRRLAPQPRGRRDLPPLASPRLPRLCGAPSSFACASPCVGRGHWGARPRDSHEAPRRDAGEGQTSVWVTQGHRDIQGTLDLPPLIRRPPVASPRGAAAQTGWKAMEMK